MSSRQESLKTLADRHNLNVKTVAKWRNRASTSDAPMGPKNPRSTVLSLNEENRKRRYLGRYFAHPMMQNRRAKRDDYKPSAVRVTQRCVP
ncbi:hypothetical protein Psal027_01311 [Piscirickettsia salmonis]|nr:hypothetical protein Psal002_01311 [Piscirickettsia salmonis]QGN85051.1 hypothetical protein Psal003_02117 [Piscirickettsia salmonis]QGN88560.1 hypothetical protein Psal004_02112 [Piscirickettsia salmonis]QGN91333.1 hypothetical protein Psal005_01363 [Piscirickettsia salmonis]QGO23205.1 hypothetical protein Psal025_01349 [Piscirickettsia salmonis]